MFENDNELNEFSMQNNMIIMYWLAQQESQAILFV
jgi:hypothetical protein